ncbi:MAG: NAD-dependent epimerase/dehydratase family protein [Planctomycetota bacterium]
MNSHLNVITGASGLLGSHIAEQLVAEGESVRVMVRAASNIGFLQSLGVEIVVGELADARFVSECVRGAGVVYHCAAHARDWGGWSDFVAANVETTRNVVDACRTGGVGRLLHVSSAACYGHPDPRRGVVTEDTQLGRDLWLWDYYIRSKLESERLVASLGAQAAIVRPTWIYGPRDVTIIPRIIRTIRSDRYWMIGRGDNPLNMGYATDMAAGAIRAARHPSAGGQTYNLCGEGQITQRELIDLLCDAVGHPRITRSVPKRLVHWAGFAMEAWGRMLGKKDPPRVTRHALAVFTRPAIFSSEKARQQLGWRPQVSPREGLSRTLAWMRASEDAARAAGGPLPNLPQ